MSDAGDEGERALALIESGGDFAAAVVGGALGLIGGPVGVAAGAAGSVTATRLFRRLGAEMHERLIAPRQHARAGRALGAVIDDFEHRRATGETPRPDWFSDDVRADDDAPSAELLEGVLLHAANEFQQRKVAHLGALFASIAFRPDISAAYANSLLRLAERLSYRQLVALAFLVENREASRLTHLDARRQEEGHWPYADGLNFELDELGRLDLIGVLQSNGSVVRPDRTWGGGPVEMVDLGNLVATPLGDELYTLMRLERVPAVEKEVIFETLGRDTRAPVDRP